MNPIHPIYIISKGRWKSRPTAKALSRIGVPFHVVVEPQEHDAYAEVIPPELLIVTPFSNLGQGSIPARNFVWEHSIAAGAKWHWILDDNIREFYRLHRNIKWRLSNGGAFAAIEDFAGRFENVAQAGMQYAMFAPRKLRYPALDINTRIYSCILLRNDLPYRWRGRYNEDTDLSLRCLKDGWCTLLFYAFLAAKEGTMRMKGGNTDELYKGGGRAAMALSLQRQHPDVVTIRARWGRPQHVVDYSPFRFNRLRLKPGAEMPSDPTFGTVLKVDGKPV